MDLEKYILTGIGISISIAYLVVDGIISKKTKERFREINSLINEKYPETKNPTLQVIVESGEMRQLDESSIYLLHYETDIPKGSIPDNEDICGNVFSVDLDKQEVTLTDLVVKIGYYNPPLTVNHEIHDDDTLLHTVNTGYGGPIRIF